MIVHVDDVLMVGTRNVTDAASHAEAELTALLEGLQTGRSVRALIELLLPDVNLEIYNDNRAAVVLASGSGAGWRTQHLRIRASCLAEHGRTDLRPPDRLRSCGQTHKTTSFTGFGEILCRGVVEASGGDVREEGDPLPPENNLRITKRMMMMLTGASIGFYRTKVSCR